MTEQVYENIMSSVGTTAAETGGVLGISDDGVVRNFYYDFSGSSSSRYYKPDSKAINDVLTNQWFPKNVYMVGIVHSHSGENAVPSCGDVQYGKRILQSINTVPFFFLPIITFNSARQATMECYVLRSVGDTIRCYSIDYKICNE